MSGKKRDELEGVISLCRAVQAGSVEPFAVDINYMLSVIRRYYPETNSLQDFCTDAAAIKGLSEVLVSQNSWIQHQSTTLYKDPFLLNQQIMKMDISAIADSFLRSWHPMVQMEQLSAKTLAGSLGYWTDLIPLAERWKVSDVEMVDAGTATMDEARALGYLPEEGFADIIENFWRELEARVGKGGRIGYWDWIGADTYEETIKRSYLTVFLVSYGYANIKVNRLQETVEIIHNVEPRPDPGQAKISIPTLVDYEEWKIWRRG
ncbi:TPA: hypothetical protein HA344_05445 [Candidatus Bathyarchaeota archaeon]|nr:hypothetical protein [Candidatus Bathyarchaeota archaeon]